MGRLRLFEVLIPLSPETVLCTLSGEKDVYLCTSIMEKRLPKRQPWEIKRLSRKSNTIGWWLLLGQLICSTAHISARPGTEAHCWKPGRMSILPLILILWHCFPLFVISNIHLRGKFAAGGFQGASVIRVSHSLSPCHPYLIKNIMNLWQCVWLDSFKNYTPWQILYLFILGRVLIDCLKEIWVEWWFAAKPVHIRTRLHLKLS